MNVLRLNEFLVQIYNGGFGVQNKVSVVVPVLNEELVLPFFLQRIQQVFDSCTDNVEFELLFVDDGSSDNSKNLIRKACLGNSRIFLISLSRNFGHQAAISAGMDYARGDAIITIDCDLQDPPELIPELIMAWLSGSDVVLAKRKSRAGETKTKIRTAHYFYRALSIISDTEISRDVADFRLLSREVVDALKSINESSPYFRGLVNWVGFSRVEIEYDRDARFAGDTKYTLRKMIKLALSGITSFSEKPLYISSVIGLFVMASTFIAASAQIVAKVLAPDKSVPGYVSLLLCILFLGGLQLFSTGILGIYLGFVSQNSKSRPRYIVAKSQSVGIIN